MKKSDCQNCIVISVSHKVIASQIVDFFKQNSFPGELESRTMDRVSRVEQENKYLKENYPQLHELIIRLFLQLNQKF